MNGAVNVMRSVAREEIARRSDALLAVVTATYPHAAADDDHNLEVDVRLKHSDLVLRGVPVGVPHVGVAAPPRVGDLVLVCFVDGQLNQPLVSSRYYHADERAPLAKADEVLFEHRVKDGTLNHLRFADDGTIFLQRDVTKPEDNSEAKTTIRIDGKSGDVLIQAGKEIVIEIKHGSELKLTCDGKPITVACKALDISCDDKMTVHGNVEVKGDLTVASAAHSTKISGNEITGA
ncbi:MAG TPA: hypothetical protein VI300_21150 [Solirubrobacter sp.]